MKCVCGHMSWNHGRVTYPRHYAPCDMCIACDRRREPGKACCLTPKPCPCRDFQNEVPPVSEPKPSDVAAEAAVWGLIETEAKKRKDEARTWLAARMGPELLAVSAIANGETVGRASYVEGKASLKVVDPTEFTSFVGEHYPTELVHLVEVNAAFQKALLDDATVVNGIVVDKNGLPIAGVEPRVSSSYVTVSKAKDAREKVAALLAGGRVSLDGPTAIEPKPEPTDRYTQDREAGAL